MLTLFFFLTTVLFAIGCAMFFFIMEGAIAMLVWRTRKAPTTEEWKQAIKYAVAVTFHLNLRRNREE